MSQWSGERTTGAEAQSEPLLEGSIVSAIILMTLAEVWSPQNSLIQKCSLYFPRNGILTKGSKFLEIRRERRILEKKVLLSASFIVKTK